MLIVLVPGMQLFEATSDSGGEEKPFDFVVHTASPYQLQVEDPVKDFLDPAIKGTTGLLHSILTHAPSVRRVVITSSSAAVINPKNHSKVYDETYWAPVTWEDAMDPKSTYRCSKVSRSIGPPQDTYCRGAIEIPCEHTPFFGNILQT